MHFTRHELTIATTDLYCYLEQQVKAKPRKLPTLVPAKIRVERVGFTRNASNTPYIVYWVGDRRCCTFIARARFLKLIQALLKLKYNIEDQIRSVVSSPNFGLWVETGSCQEYIASTYVRKFFERYNCVALERIVPSDNCGCIDLYDMCVHQIANVLHSKLEDYIYQKTT